MDSVVNSKTKFIDAATKSGFFDLVDKNVHQACMLISKKVTPKANKNRHLRIVWELRDIGIHIKKRYIKKM